jgi:putative ABC transport system permease protein
MRNGSVTIPFSMIDHITQSLWIAVEAISHNKLRAILTSLGIVFGVGSVISMLAVGTGAKQEILEQMKLLGASNIIITPVVEQEEGKVEEDELTKAAEKKRFSPGLTLQDAESIQRTLPDVVFTSPEVVVETMVLREGLKRTSKLVGVDSTYFGATDFVLERGRIFSKKNMELASPVAVIGHSIKTRFFAKEDPIGGRIKCGNLWLTVVGVLQERTITKQSIQHLGLRDYNYDIYTPVSALLLRYKNRTLVTRLDVQRASRATGGPDDSEPKKPTNYHQLDRLVVRVSNTEKMSGLAEVISRMLERRHNNVVDFQVTIPEQLLRQEQRTKEIFNIVLGAIASISLIVGGIGIMNIMLASVMERTKEIGIRRAMGATRRDIVLQFLSEATMISVTGGIIGILLGVGLSFAIQKLAGIQTIVSAISVFLSFVISISIGIAFGLFPARRAAEQDPVICLRYE